MQTKNKIIKRQNAFKVLKNNTETGQSIVFTNGCFDILHSGHVSLLERAKSLGDILFLALNTDESVKRLKGEKRPINDQKERARIVAGLEAVDYVTFFSEDTPKKIIKEVNPDILVKGGDYKPEEVIGRKHVEKSGGEVITLPLKKGKSTTNLIDKITGLYCKKLR